MDLKLKLVAIYGIGGVILTAINALTHHLSYGIFQVDILIDLTLQFPFILYIFVEIYRSIEGSTDSIGAILSITIFSYGYGIHLAADAIAEYIQTKNYQNTIPSDMGDVIYLFDEIIGHLVLFLGLFASFVVLRRQELRNLVSRADLDSREKVLIITFGIGFGSVLGIYLIEASYFILWGIGWSTAWMIVTRRTTPIIHATHVYASILWFTHLGIVLAATVYYILFGSFIEPSELFGF